MNRYRQRSKVELNFHFKVDAKADSGDHQLEFTIKDSSGTSLSKRIPIRVEGNPDLVLIGTEIFPVIGEIIPHQEPSSPDRNFTSGQQLRTQETEMRKMSG